MGRVTKTVDPYEVLCDFDYPGDYYRQRRGPVLGPIWVTLRTCGLTPQWMQFRKTRKGWHLVIRFWRPLLPAEQVAIQAVLGSDRRREGLNLMRVLCMRQKGASAFWRGRWNVLFDRKLTT